MTLIIAFAVVVILGASQAGVPTAVVESGAR